MLGKKAGSFILALVFAASLLLPAGGNICYAEDAGQTVSSFTDLQNAIDEVSDIEMGDGQLHYLTVNISGTLTVDQPLVIPEGLAVTLQGASEESEAVLKKDTVVWSEAEGLLQVEGTLSLNNITIDGNQMEECIRVAESGTLYVNAGSVIQNGCYRGTISVGTKTIGCGIANFGTCILDGGTIQNNRGSWSYGGGIYNAGTMEIKSGTITGNACSSYSTTSEPMTLGGGIHNAGMLTMSGGSITSNTAEKGGGVYNTGTFVMNGSDASITSNTATSTKNVNTGSASGGGVYVAEGTFTLEEGTISGNKAYSQIKLDYPEKTDYVKLGGTWGCGGGVYISNRDAGMIMTGGSVESNRAYGQGDPAGYSGMGGGIYVQGGTKELTLFSGSGVADFSGIRSAGKLTLTGGTISKNYARSYGSGVYAGNEEYLYWYIGTGTAYYGTWEGPVTLKIGGSVQIQDNTGTYQDNLYLTEGIRMQICEALQEDAMICLTAESGEVDTVIGVYDSADLMNETDAGHFQASGSWQPTVGVNRQGEAEESYYLYLSSVSLEDGYNAVVNPSCFIYDGTAKEPEVTVTDPNGKELVLGQDYTVSYENNTQAGTGYAVITGMGNYKDTLRAEFEIEAVPLDSTVGRIVVAENELTTGQLSYTYDGTAKTPGASYINLSDTVTGKTLLRNTDYTISYENNIEMGTAKMIVQGMGNYTGTLSFAYRITGESKWMKNSKGYWYQYADGSYPVNKWAQISGKWYHFDASGYMQTGWQKISGKWYYLGAVNDGAMKTGWQQIAGKWYYMSSSGAMQTGWLKLGNTWYYLNGNGVMQTGWIEAGNNWYYFYSNGAMAANTWVGNYYLKSSGAMARSEWVANGKYYVDQNGLWVPGK